MRNKSLLGLLLMVLLAMPLLAACGAVSESGDGTWDTPHVLTGGFANCFICHTGGRSAIPFATHMSFNLETCARPECHPLAKGVEAPPVTP